MVSYRTTKEMIAEYSKHIREMERQFNYEQAMVCSVPISTIEPVSFDAQAIDRCQPG